jgi:hypothetical protein
MIFEIYGLEAIKPIFGDGGFVIDDERFHGQHGNSSRCHYSLIAAGNSWAACYAFFAWPAAVDLA